MKAKEKNNLENLIEKYEIYSKFYKSLSFEKINRGTIEEKIDFWKELLDKNGYSNDYYFFVYSILTDGVKNILGYDYLYGMSDQLRNDKDFEEILVLLSGNANLVNYISNVNSNDGNIIYKDSKESEQKHSLQQNNPIKRLV